LLVPDETILDVVRERLRTPEIKNLGVIFDGFPRTVVQAEALSHLLREVGRSLSRVVSIELPYETVVQRLSARRVCEQCGMEYNLLFYPPKVSKICDQCGGNLIQRDDDTEEIIRNRLRVSEDARLALRDFYMKRGFLREIDGDGTADQVFTRLVEALES
jgi:adenylate kinase